ncbi:DUF2927 domain-containing protein [Hydrogenovibrio sp. JE_KL2]|uniref:DUF2927 domain-containing protein n=1 Tax=Hydrogenovibrio sp. JE_KL2 TaxID=2651188 RepID=UPI00128DEEA3|nr:DUF2927 domain-containing protein [Hydrogenovibrio sp. JE_KL2]MPQ77433.1 DUF2927 domain-containing protein [Hydrogenovibrio sp. JE_KL2]
MRKFWRVPAVFLTLFLLGNTGNTNLYDWQKPDYIEKAFVEITLKDEYRATDMHLRKWTSPIRYYIDFYGLKPYPLAINMINAHMRQLTHITHHSIAQTHIKQEANLIIYLSKDRDYKTVIEKYTGNKVQDLSRESNCMGTFKQSQSHVIIGATVVIPIDYAMSQGLLPSCIVEELTQVMGLPNDSDWVYPSVANDVSKVELLSGLDYLFLKMLYSPQLKPGMNLIETKKVVKKLIREFQQQGLIKRANMKVRQEGLYPLLY